MRRPLVIALDGISGTGKSRTAAALADALGAVPIAEAYDRLVPRPRIDVRGPAALARVERALFREELRRWTTARATVGAGRPVVADTGFFGPLTYSAGLVAAGRAPPGLVGGLLTAARRAAGRGAWGIADLTIVLSVPPEVRRRRIAADPDRHPPSLAERHAIVGRWEERFLIADLARAFPGRVGAVRADRPLGEVVAAVRRRSRGVRPFRHARAAADRALATFADAAARSVRSATVKKAALPAGAPRR